MSGNNQPPVYRACSGQSRPSSRFHWGVCRSDAQQPWWRDRKADGRIRLFASFYAANAHAEELNRKHYEETP